MNTVYIVVGIVFLVWFVGGLIRRSHHKNRVIHVVESNCTGCGSCVKRCNHHVFAIMNGETGKHVVARNFNKCTGCGDCIGKCKFNALKLVEKNK
jgi:NAD-dependent dihydropyrimidine dehydrogenase PreA subunit